MEIESSTIKPSHLFFLNDVYIPTAVPKNFTNEQKNKITLMGEIILLFVCLNRFLLKINGLAPPPHFPNAATNDT